MWTSLFNVTPFSKCYSNFVIPMDKEPWFWQTIMLSENFSTLFFLFFPPSCRLSFRYSPKQVLRQHFATKISKFYQMQLICWIMVPGYPYSSCLLFFSDCFVSWFRIIFCCKSFLCCTYTLHIPVINKCCEPK